MSFVANDEPVQLCMLQHFFTKYGFDVETAVNGQEAYEKVELSMVDQDSLFSLIVLDLNMPISSG
jgi:CheY-like chemotaxis protein